MTLHFQISRLLPRLHALAALEAYSRGGHKSPALTSAADRALAEAARQAMLRLCMQLVPYVTDVTGTDSDPDRPDFMSVTLRPGADGNNDNSLLLHRAMEHAVAAMMLERYCPGAAAADEAARAVSACKRLLAGTPGPLRPTFCGA